VPNVPGSLADALSLLAEHQVGIDYMYAFAMKDDMARVVIKPDHITRCLDVLQHSNLRVARESDMYDFYSIGFTLILVAFFRCFTGKYYLCVLFW
jgi:hypothetical protein